MFSKVDNKDKDKIDRAFTKLKEKYGENDDPWGLNLGKARKSIDYIYPIYKNYFKVRVFGKENVENKQYMVISNHSGQVAIDGMLIGTAFTLDIDPPRILRPMVAGFYTELPFINKWSSECGSVLGDRENCLNLLERGESLLVFPEGVRGVSKSTSEFYHVQEFTRGFYRMAMKANVEILPIAVIGAEEFFPYVYQARGLAKKLGLPALPISANYFPLPSPVDIYIGKPIKPECEISEDCPDKGLDPLIDKIEQNIQDMVSHGLENRREFWPFVTKGKK